MSGAPEIPNWKRLALFAGLSLATMSYALGLTVFGPAVAPLAGDLGVSEALVGALGSWMSAGYLLGAFGGGPLAERAGLRLPTLLGLASMGAGFFLISRCGGYAGAALGISLFGAGGALVEIGANAAVADLFPSRRVAALNLLHVFFGVAAVAGPRLSGSLVESPGGWRHAYYLLSLGALPALPLLLALPFPRSGGGGKDSETREAPASLWREPTLYVLAAAVLFYVGAEISVNNWAVLFLGRKHGWSAADGAAAVSNFWLAMTAGRIVVSLLGEGRGPVRAETLLLVLSAGSAAALVGLALWAQDPWTLGALVVAAGGLFSGIFPTLFAIGAGRFPGRSAAVSAVLLGAAGLALFVLTPLVGFLAEGVGIARAFALAPLYAAALLLCVHWLWKRRPA